jgi:AraC family transcriptional regulator
MTYSCFVQSAADSDTMEGVTKTRKPPLNLTDCDSETTRAPEYAFTPPLGKQLSKLTLPDFVLTESVYDPCSVIPTHAHKNATLGFILAGNSVETLASEKYSVEPGTLIIRPAGISHSDHNGRKGLRSLNIEVNPKQCPYFDFSEVFSRPSFVRCGLLWGMARRIYRESKIEDTAAPMVVEGLILEFLGNASRSLFRVPVRAPSWLERARELCHDRFAEQLTLTEIARSVGAHPTHIARSFKKHYGATVGEYIRGLRLDWAASRLETTDESIADIAAAAGFYDQSHFSHHFKKYLGASPLEFRASRSHK